MQPRKRRPVIALLDSNGYPSPTNVDEVAAGLRREVGGDGRSRSHRSAGSPFSGKIRPGPGVTTGWSFTYYQSDESQNRRHSAGSPVGLVQVSQAA